MARETVLVTGASSGIGEALACQFASAGYDLVLVARSTAKLQALAGDLRDDCGVDVIVEPLDLAEAGAAQRLQQRLDERQVVVDVLVNNAGVLEHGRFVDKSVADFKKIIDLNISALTEMLHAFLPPMLERKRGRILNVGSIAAFQAVPSLAVYAASKAYVLSLTEALSEEHRGSGVTFTALCPGVTETPMVARVEETEGSKKVPDFLVGDVHKVAQQGFAACIRGEVICIPELVNRAAVLGLSKSPRWLTRRLTGLFGRNSV